LGKYIKSFLISFIFVTILLAPGCSTKTRLEEDSIQAVANIEDVQEAEKEENSEESRLKDKTKEKIEKEVNKEEKSENKINKQSNSNSDPKSNKDLSSSDENKEAEPNPEPKPTKFVYLTFDDGPSEVTGEILDVLKNHNVKATFFVNGISIKNQNESIYAHMIKRMVEEGHAIGNHGYFHDYSITYASKEKFKENVDKLDKYLQEIAGVKTRLFRFQGGTSNTVYKKHLKGTTMKELFKLIRSSGYRYFDWNVDSNDSAQDTPSASSSVKNVLKGIKGKDNSIVLMHDSIHKTEHPDAVNTIITELKEQGYGFKKLSMDSYNSQHRK